MSFRRRRVALVAALAVSVFVVAGCTTSSQARSAQSSKPVRPRSIDLHKVDVCALLTQQQRQQFNLGGTSIPGGGTDPGGGPMNCSFTDTGYNLGVLVEAFTSKGIDALDKSIRDVNRDPKIQSLQVAGFPAKVFRPIVSDRSNTLCYVVVDVADGQAIYTSLHDYDPNVDVTNGPTVDQLCQTLQQITEAATTSLKSSG